MTNLSLINELALRLLSRFIGRKSKSAKSVEPAPVNYETINEIKGDMMDYDGMGNYGRFPCINK
tara:strand:+ start:317 stop:508 length:192 start_codon:yes stop_codon:yes gene_type:complete